MIFQNKLIKSEKKADRALKLKSIKKVSGEEMKRIKEENHDIYECKVSSQQSSSSDDDSRSLRVPDSESF